MHFFGMWEETREPGGPYTDTGRTCVTLQTELRINLGTLYAILTYLTGHLTKSELSDWPLELQVLI